MKNLLLIVLFGSLCLTGYGQFRSTSWNHSMKQAGKSEGIPINKHTTYDFKNGKRNHGMKMEYTSPGYSADVTQNLLFIHDELKVGSYTFSTLDLPDVDLLVADLSTEHGGFQYAYGNAKLETIYEAPGNEGYLDYLYNGNSLQFTWEPDEKSVVVLRIINTNSDLFGIWGWLSYYEKDYYHVSIEPQYIKNLKTTAIRKEKMDQLQQR